MTPTEMIDSAVDRYLDAVRNELGGIPEQERDDLLDDLAQHLREVSAEEDGDLEARLGSPADYARELLASAGLEPRTPRLPRSERLRARLRRIRREIATHPRSIEVLDAASAGRPVWWLVRGYLLVLLWGVFSGGAVALATWPFPRLWGSRLAGLIATLLVIPASYALGKRAGDGRLPRAVNIAANVSVALLVFASGSRITWAAQAVWWPPQVVVEGEEPPQHGELQGPAGEITNIYPFDADGRPLEGVLLYDQYGNPIEIIVDYTPDGLPIVTSYPLDEDGEPVTNAFPQHQAVRRDAHDGGYPERDITGRPEVTPPRLRTSSSPHERADTAAPGASPSPDPSMTGRGDQPTGNQSPE